VKFYKYWAQGEATVRSGQRPWRIRAYGGSNDSLQDALRAATATAQRAAAALEKGQPRGRYGYADRPVREEIVEEIRRGDELRAVITRNSYGALVLNTPRVMFVDVDHFSSLNPRTGAGGMTLREQLTQLWDWLRGAPSTVKRDREQRFIDRFQQVLDQRPGLGARVYRTSGGFRLLITSGEFDPTAAESHRLLEAFGSDPLYVRLCKTQECFRARLSAKFWRCHAPRPPARFPWADASEEAAYRRWEQEYHRLANQCATCELVQTLGEPAVHENVAPILETHDRLTIRPGAPLA
jgi:hypothetical protein